MRPSTVYLICTSPHLTFPRGKVRLSRSNSLVCNSYGNQDQAGLLYPNADQVFSATEFLCKLAPDARNVVPSAVKGYLEINIESCTWSGYQVSAVAPHLQTTPPGLVSVPSTPQQSLGQGWPNRPMQTHEASSGATSYRHWQWSLFLKQRKWSMCNLEFY